MEKINVQLKIEELNIILEGLGNLPFNKVHDLIYNLQNQVQESLQLKGAKKEIPNIDKEKKHVA